MQEHGLTQTRKVEQYCDADSACNPVRGGINKPSEVAINRSTYDIKIFTIADLEGPNVQHNLPQQVTNFLYLAIFRVEMSKGWDILFSLWKGERQLARRVVLAEQDVCDSVAGCIAEIPCMDNGGYRLVPRHGNC